MVLEFHFICKDWSEGGVNGGWGILFAYPLSNLVLKCFFRTCKKSWISRLQINYAFNIRTVIMGFFGTGRM